MFPPAVFGLLEVFVFNIEYFALVIFYRGYFDEGMDKRHIVFLDTSTLHSGEFDLSVLAQFGELICYPTTTPDEVIDRCREAHTIISNKVILNADTISQCGELKQIHTQHGVLLRLGEFC